MQDLSRAIAECGELGYYSPTVRHAQQSLEQFTSHNKIRKKLKEGIAQFEIASIKHGLEMAKFANIPDNDALITEAVHTLKFIDSEKALLHVEVTKREWTTELYK